MNEINFGTVVDIIDPEKLGRVKVSVYGVHDNIETKDLPWTMVVMPGNTPAKSGVGHSTNLLVGTLVCGIFLDKDDYRQEFLIIGSLPTKTDGTKDNNARVRGEADPNAAEPLGEYQPESTYAPEYPYNNVYETESGHVKEYDDTPGLERITERHKSGTRYEITANGSKNETIVRDNYQLVLGHNTVEVYGNAQIIVSGHCDLAVAGNLSASITGDIEVDSAGNITLKNNDTAKRIILDGHAIVRGNLVVDKTTTTSADTGDRSPIVLDTHVHDDYDSPTVETGPPK
jgi:hypothetical protein